jgi:hypothetical protein
VHDFGVLESHTDFWKKANIIHYLTALIGSPAIFDRLRIGIIYLGSAAVSVSESEAKSTFLRLPFRPRYPALVDRGRAFRSFPGLYLYSRKRFRIEVGLKGFEMYKALEMELGLVSV